MASGIPMIETAQIARNSLGFSLRSARAMSRARFAPKSRCSTTLLSCDSAALEASMSWMPPWPVVAAALSLPDA